MKRTLKKGLYLVVDPSVGLPSLMDRLRQVVDKGIVAVQIWDNFTSEDELVEVCSAIIKSCHEANVPVILNNHWEEAVRLGADGVHFDAIPYDWPQIKKQCKEEMLIGLTVNNDLNIARWAISEQLDYVSFCSMFPSETANSCDLVALESVRELTEAHDIPVFLAGGIRPDNLHHLHELDYYGIAVVSGVMGAERPAEAVELYLDKIKK